MQVHSQGHHTMALQPTSQTILCGLKRQPTNIQASGICHPRKKCELCLSCEVFFFSFVVVLCSLVFLLLLVPVFFYILFLLFLLLHLVS